MLWYFQRIKTVVINLYKNKKIMRVIDFVIATTDDKRALIPRVLVGLVFLSEGIQKFLYPELVGVGRFTKIGFEHPEFWAGFTAVFEIVCGLMIFSGLFVRLAVIPILVIMTTAIITTKIPILHDSGFWYMAHAARTDFAMTLTSVFLLIYGSGKWSVDKWMERKW